MLEFNVLDDAGVVASSPVLMLAGIGQTG